MPRLHSQIKKVWRPTRWQRGVTLVELMIVVTLIGALSALATPSVLRTLDRMEARAAARDVANAFRMARDHAMSRKTVMMAVMSGGSGVYNIDFYRSNLKHCTALELTDPEDIEDYVLAHTLEFSARFPKMRKPDWNPSTIMTATSPLCITPSGKFVSVANQPLQNTITNCGRYNTIIFTGRADWDPTSNNAHHCVDEDSATDADRQTLKDLRDADNVYLIHLGYNGSIDIIQ